MSTSNIQKYISRDERENLMRKIMGWKPNQKVKLYNIRKSKKGDFSCLIGKMGTMHSGLVIHVNCVELHKVFVFNFPISHLNAYNDQSLSIYFGTNCSPQKNNIHWQYCVGYY